LAGTGVAGSSPLQPAYPMAMAFGGRLLTAAGAGPFLCIFADEVTFSGARRFGISINLQQTMFQVTRGTAATLNVTTQAPAIQVGEEFVILYQAWPVGLEVWQDGVRTRSLPDANPDFDYGPTPFLGLAGFPGANSLTTLISPGLWAAWWRRPISAQEAQAITASPAAIWRMFRAPTRHISLPPTEPPAATLRRRSLYLRTGSRGQRV
jgi:hypothetical protein